MKSRKFNLFAAAVLATVGLLVYCQVINFGFVPYDDPAYVSGNRFVSEGFTLEGLRWAFLYGSGLEDLSHGGVENLWHPLTWLSHMLDGQLFGVEKAAGHHAMNLVLFLVSGLLVFWVFGQLLPNRWAAFWIALLWMAHPLKVESVAWVSERKDVLSGLFFWASLGCAIKTFGEDRKWWKWAGYFLFVAGLLSKPSVVVLPVLIVLVKGFQKEERSWELKFWWQELQHWWVWFVTAVVVALVTVTLQAGGSHQYLMQNTSLGERLVPAAAGFWFYLWRVLVPVDLTYEYTLPRWGLSLFALAWLALLAMGGVVWRMRKKWPTVFVGAVWFVVCWLPVSGLVYVGTSFTTDRYVYLGLAGVLVIVIRALERLRGFGIYLALIGLLWMGLSWKQVSVWKNGWTLFKHATLARPTMVSGWTNLGGMNQEANRFKEAEKCYLEALRLNGKDHVAWFNLGNVRNKIGKKEGAEEAYERAIEINPDYLPANLNLGLLKLEAGNVEKARDLFRKGEGKDVRLMWLSCKCELHLENFSEALVLLEKLDRANVQHPEVRAGMEQARKFLRAKNHGTQVD